MRVDPTSVRYGWADRDWLVGVVQTGDPIFLAVGQLPGHGATSPFVLFSAGPGDIIFSFCVSYRKRDEVQTTSRRQHVQLYTERAAHDRLCADIVEMRHADRADG